MNVKYKNTEYLRTENHFYDKHILHPFHWEYCLMCKHCKQENSLILKCNLKDIIIWIDTTDFILDCNNFEKRGKEE